MYRRLLLLGFSLLFILPVFAAGATGGVLISEIYTDPLGTDTGKEFVELVNMSPQPIDISGWEIDPDQLPYISIPPQTILAGYTTYTVYLRQNGTSSGTAMYTGTALGSTNIGNTKGSVALFRPGGRDAAHLEDFVQWGEANQTHSASAAETGMFDAALFTIAPPEGQSLTRICLDNSVSCFVPNAATPEQTNLTFVEEEESGTGVTVETSVVVPELLPAILQLQYVAMNNPSGTADDIGIYVADDGNDGQGRALMGHKVRVDAQEFSLKGLSVKTGDTIHISFGTGMSRAVTATHQLVWPQVAGLVATSEQVFLYADSGLLQDVVCWFRDPVPESERSEMELAKTLWAGDCLPSSGVPSGGVLQRHVFAPEISAASWTVPSQAPVNTGAMPSLPQLPATSVIPACIPSAEIRLSEIFPNPPNADSGQEWVELYNPTSQEVSLCGLRLDDEEGGSPPFDLAGYSIPAGKFLLIHDKTSKLVLGNTADSVRLLKASGEVIDSVTYEDAPSGKSMSKI